MASVRSWRQKMSYDCLIQSLIELMMMQTGRPKVGRVLSKCVDDAGADRDNNMHFVHIYVYVCVCVCTLLHLERRIFYPSVSFMYAPARVGSLRDMERYRLVSLSFFLDEKTKCINGPLTFEH